MQLEESECKSRVNAPDESIVADFQTNAYIDFDCNHKNDYLRHVATFYDGDNAGIVSSVWLNLSRVNLADVRVYQMLLWILKRRRKEIQVILAKIKRVKEKLQPADAPYFKMILEYLLWKRHQS